MKLSRRQVCGLLAVPLVRAAAKIGLSVADAMVRIETADASYRFRKRNGKWAFDSVWVRGRKTATALSPEDSFWIGGGEASAVEVLADPPQRKEIRFQLGAGSIAYRVDADDRLPRVHVELSGVSAPTCAWRTAAASPDQHGAWATRGETASDAEDREAFIDGSGRLVFGHSTAGPVDAAYVYQADVLDNIHRRGKTAQPSDTFFRSGRKPERGGYFGWWQLRIGEKQPKRFAMVIDRDLGGRLHDVCERYYADAVDTQVDLASIPETYDPHLALERMPLRLSCPESLIPGYGWHMEEYFPGYAKAAYPYGEDSGIQTAALLAFEGHATRRDWEQYFGEHVIGQMPLWADADGRGFFVQRLGGWTRWAYNTDYRTPFPLMEGGNWTDAEHLYRIAVAFGDAALKERALGLMRHDIHVKLDLEKMWFPACWNPISGKLEDHRDDWETTAALGYCAEASSEILYTETGEKQYLEIADRITGWLASHWGPELRMNFLHSKVNTFHCFMGPLVRSMVHRYERGGGTRFLEIAQDLAWVMILTLCVTPHRDPAGRSLTGVTCVGVRGCVDYDCAPNLCHEKDLAFLDIMGALLAHVGGPGYAKFLAMQRLVLPRDSWKDAFHIQEQRDLNLRTNYDNYARGMANLAFALNRGSDPNVAIYERLAPVRDLRIIRRRDIVLANATTVARRTRVVVRFLEEGEYRLELDGKLLGVRTAAELAKGIEVEVASNSTRRMKIAESRIAAPVPQVRSYDDSETWLSDMEEAASQRGIGLPTPVFRKDQTFRGNPIMQGGKLYEKGIGLAANTVIVYGLDGRYRSFAATFGVDADAAGEGPAASVYLTIFVDGRCRFTSGGTTAAAAPRPVDIDVRNAQVLVIRMSGNWDDNGDLRNDLASLADARLIGRAL